MKPGTCNLVSVMTLAGVLQAGVVDGRSKKILRLIFDLNKIWTYR